MQNDLIKYLEYEKSGLNVNEEDFLRILDKVNLESQVPSPSFAYSIKSPFFAWTFGFSGVMAAVLMFIFTDINNINTENNSVVAYNNNTSTYNEASSLTTSKKKAIMAIESIDSFSNIDTE